MSTSFMIDAFCDGMFEIGKIITLDGIGNFSLCITDENFNENNSLSMSDI